MPHLTFLFPWVLAAAAAAAIPVIIHLRMRQKPRLQVFPAIRFLQKSLLLNTTRLRIRHWLLLAMRMAILLLLALLIARPVLPKFISASDWSKQAAVVVVIDNSASMGYRYQGDTHLGRGKRLAQQVIESLPGGSKVAVVASGSPAEPAEFLGDATLAAQRVADVGLSEGSRALAGAINRATELLNTQDMPRKEVLIVTDMASQAWGENPDLSLSEGVSFVVLNCAGGDQANLALGAVQLSSAYLPLGTQVVVRSDLRAAKLSAEAPVQFVIDSEGVQEQTIQLSAGSAAALAAAYRVMDEGDHAGVVVLAADDALAIDNRRYFSFQGGPPPTAVLVRDADADSNLTAEATGHAVAPGGEVLLGQWVQRQTVAPGELTAAVLADAPVVILADVASLTAQGWDLLAGYVRGGGNLWVVAGPRLAVDNYNTPPAQQVIPLVLGNVQELSPPTTLLAASTTDAMLEPFEDKANPPLSQVVCRRRLAVRVLAVDARAPLVYENDRTPAIVRRTIGRGEVVFWNLSPDAGFSNLVSLPQFVILAQRTVRLLSAQGLRTNQVLVGNTVVLSVPRGMPTPMITLRRPGAAEGTPISADAGGQVNVPADQPGHYVVSFTQDQRTVRQVFAANVDARESDLSAAPDKQIQAMFPSEQVLLASTLEDLAQRRRAVSQPLHLDVPLLLALLALMLGESLLANRFYRTASAEDTVIRGVTRRQKVEQAPAGSPVGSPRQGP